MPSLVVVGAQWGDEGKGKLVDFLTARADWTVRFHGGNNAGHTLVVNGIKTKLSLVPSGILNPQTRCLIGAGVVVDPKAILNEINGLRASGVSITPQRLIIDRNAHLILPYHIAIDQAREEAKGKDKIGTTGRGIGPCYEDKAARTGVRFAELLQLDVLKERLQKQIEERNKYLSAVLNSSAQVSFDEVSNLLAMAAKELTPFIGNVSLTLQGAIHRNERIVFEGAQGTYLDISHGTVPFVTSSNTLAGAVTTGCGIGAKCIDHVLAVTKAYSTRVGSGPFPTELKDALGDQIREKGGEFGTITGRARRCGWLDAVALRRAVHLNGADTIALTKLDVLSGIDKLKICVKYKLDGTEIEDLPALATEVDRIVPQYAEFEGWKENLQGIAKWHELPAAAKLYLGAVAEMVGIPISIVSVAPERNSTIFSRTAGFLENFLLPK